MSNVMVAPEFVRQAAGQLQNIGSSLTEANAAASTPTTAVLAPASDEVSAAITALMGTHAQQFQAVSAQAAKFHSQFVGLLNTGAAAYSGTEAANTQPLADLTPEEIVDINHKDAALIEALAENDLRAGRSDLTRIDDRIRRYTLLKTLIPIYSP